jgi:hypothetical protein
MNMIKKLKADRLFNKNKIAIFLAVGLASMALVSCESADEGVTRTASSNIGNKPASSPAEAAVTESTAPPVKGERDNTSVCLVPEAPGTTVYENEYAHLDASNTSEGYIVVRYTGDSGKVKLQITGPSEITYTYNLTVGNPTDEVFPLQSGNGQYLVNVFENLQGTQYTTVFSQMVDVTLTNEFGPFLYPNQYCTFSADSLAVKKAEDLAFTCNNDLEVVSEVYNFMIENIKYDYDEAETVQSGYLPDINEVMTTKKGICLDYSALMCSMLRSQRIPTRMEIGYAGTAYHAWISTYIEDIGWVNGMIQFDGKEWSLMDPTFASNTEEKALKDFIGDGKNYSVKYIY